LKSLQPSFPGLRELRSHKKYLMEDNFNQNNFEDFLKEQVKNHRMYPNDTVWRDIHTKLHGDGRWPALTIAACTLLSATIAISVYFTPKPDIFAINPSNELKNSTLSNSQHNIGLNNLASSSLYKQKTSFSDLEKNKTQSITPVSRDISAVNDPAATGKNETVSFIKPEDKNVNVSAINDKVINQRGDLKEINAPAIVNADAETLHDLENFNSPILSKKITVSDVIKPLTQHPKAAEDYNDKNMADNFLKEHKDDIPLHTASKIKSGKNKFGFQIYIAPSVSYRKLTEDPAVLKEGNNEPGPVGLNYVADVNKVVRHKPGNGLEAGVSILYYLSDHFRLKSGFQFNVRQYSIEAYRSGTEVASIALVENNRIDTTITTLAIYRNNNGYYPAELVNRYYQLSVPVGLEWEIIGNKRIQFNIAGSIQPTYLINRNAYLLSTNFKNYSENPDMVRSFNINSNIETYISFKAGDFKWQIGPQLRYQPYSTFIPQYPIKEHLLDYGIKLGLSKTF